MNLKFKPGFNFQQTLSLIKHASLISYSYDGRAKPGTHAKNEVLLGQRAYFRTVTEPASLSIDNVSENDAGK